jgi:hypothetical protein
MNISRQKYPSSRKDSPKSVTYSDARTEFARAASDFESDVVQPNTSFGAELKRRNASKASDCLGGHRVAADADNDAGFSVSGLTAQSHGLQRALTPGPIRCLFCDR